MTLATTLATTMAMNGVSLSTAAAAQPAAQPSGPIEEVTVTGSRIQRSDATSPAPISVISEDDMRQRGTNSIADVLQIIPQATGTQTNSQSNNGGRGTASVNLRGLGSQRTLVLVNGRRMVATDNLGTSLDVDLNNIPQAMIERVEVLRDGASAIYGSDAIGGVINVITKKDFEGIGVNLNAGISDEGDGEQYSGDLTLGGKFGNDDRGRAWVNVGWFKQRPVYSRDRSFSKRPKDADLLDDGTVDVYEFGSSFTPTGTAVRLETGDAVVMNPDGVGFTELTDDNRFNYSDYQYNMTPQKRITFAGQAEYDVADYATAYVEALYVKRNSSQSLAPPPMVVPNTTGFYVPADNPFNPFGEDVLLFRRLADVGGAREYKQEVNTYRFVVGLKGDITDDWSYDVSYTTGRNEMNAQVFGLGRLDHINQGFLDPVGCETAPGCVPVNLFGSNIGQQELDYIRYTEFSKQTVQQDVGEAGVTGTLFETGAGKIGLATGVAWRRESYRDDVDSITESGASSDGERLSSRGHYDVKEIYGEVSVPLVSGKSFADYLGVDIAGRYSDYSTIGGVFSWKVGAQYAPVPSIRFRGVYSRAFRAPDVLELYAGRKINFPTFSDPCNNPSNPTVVSNCQMQGVADPANFEQRDTQVNTVEEGSADLKEERANTWTIGAVFTPEFLPNLSVTLDYYRIDVKNAIEVLDAQVVLDQCLSSPDMAANPLCGLIETRDASGQLTRIVTQTSNIGRVKTSGIDAGMNYSHGLGSEGTMSYALAGTYLLKLRKQPFPGLPYDAYQGRTGGFNINANPKLRVNWVIAYSDEHWAANYSGRLIGKSKSFTTRDNPVAGSVRYPIKTYTYHDFQGGYNFGNGFELTVGVRNAFDKKPPYYFDYDDANTDPSTYDTIGRYFYTALRAKF